MRNMFATRPSVGVKKGSRRMETRLPSIARWKTSATMRPPMLPIFPPFSPASRST